MELEAVVGAELMLKPRSRGRDADPFLQRGQRVLGKADAVISHFDP